MFSLSFLLPNYSCISSARNITQLAALGIQVVKLLKECDEHSNIFSSKVREVNAVMEEGIKTNKNVLELGKYWEKYWADIHSDYNSLKEKFIETNNVSQEYFAEYENNNNSFTNETLRLQGIAKLEKLKDDYNAQYSKTLNNLNSSEKLLKQGDDVLLVLRNEVLAGAIQNQIEVLKNISVQSDALSQNMKYFSNTCIPLFAQK